MREHVTEFAVRKNLYDKIRFKINGDRSLLLECGDGIDLTVNEKVRRMTEILRVERPEGVESVIPAYRSLSVVYDPLRVSVLKLREHIWELEHRLDRTEIPAPRFLEIPVCYGMEFGPDIEFVAEHNHITLDDVVHLHTLPSYHVFAVGFIPGFCFLGGLPKQLHTPRLETPRMSVPAGSVGIAECQTGVYPLESPGGWQLIGRTPLRLFAPDRPDPFLCRVGDNIRFVAISEDEFDRKKGQETT